MRKITSAIVLATISAIVCAGTTFTWRERISIRDIPDTPVKGMLNGQPFSVEFARVKSVKNKPDVIILQMYDKTPAQGRECGFIGPARNFTLRFPKDEKRRTWAMREKKDRKKEVASYAYVKDKGGTQIVAGSWAAAIVIDSLDSTGIKGKIALCFKEKDGFKNWVAGRFEASNCLE